MATASDDKGSAYSFVPLPALHDRIAEYTYAFHLHLVGIARLHRPGPPHRSRPNEVTRLERELLGDVVEHVVDAEDHVGGVFALDPLPL